MKTLKSSSRVKEVIYEIYDYTIENGHLITHATAVLKQLQKENRLNIISADLKSVVRKGAFFIGWPDVKTNNPKCFINIK